MSLEQGLWHSVPQWISCRRVQNHTVTFHLSYLCLYAVAKLNNENYVAHAIPFGGYEVITIAGTNCSTFWNYQDLAHHNLSAGAPNPALSQPIPPKTPQHKAVCLSHQIIQGSVIPPVGLHHSSKFCNSPSLWFKLHPIESLLRFILSCSNYPNCKWV